MFGDGIKKGRIKSMSDSINDEIRRLEQQWKL
jgi:Arc/MetJ-type ribon-helix-helix transcriptional regulator